MIGTFVGKVFGFISKLPAFVLVFLFPIALIAFIGSIIGLFWALANIEGVATLLMLLGGYGMANVLAFEALVTRKPEGSSSFTNFFTAGLVAFYALMGMAIDQPGNYVLNKPLEWFFCPENTALARGVEVLHPLPGRTDMIQQYTCLNTETNEVVAEIDMFAIIGTRFVEYVIIGFAFIEILKFVKKKKQEHS